MRVFVGALLMFLMFGCQAQHADGVDVNVAEAQEMIEKGEVVIIDVRTDSEFAGGHIENAVQINYQSSNFEAKLAELPKDQTYLVYCHSGNRSGKAITKMQELGFTKAHNLKGGIVAWRDQAKAAGQ